MDDYMRRGLFAPKKWGLPDDYIIEKYRVFIKDCFFPWKCLIFLSSASSAARAWVSPATVYTHWHRGETERGQSPDYILKSSTQYLMNTLYLLFQCFCRCCFLTTSYLKLTPPLLFRSTSWRLCRCCLRCHLPSLPRKKNLPSTRICYQKERIHPW